MDQSRNTDNFKGTVDQFLKHCAEMNVDTLYDECERRDCMQYIMRETNCSEEEAAVLYEEISMNEVKNTLDNLVKDGIVEISGYNEEGEPLYSLTDLGRKIQEDLNKSKE